MPSSETWRLSASFRAKVETQLVNTVDILPTMLKEAGLDIPSNLAGRPLQDLQDGKPWRQYNHSFSIGGSPRLFYPQFAINDERFKLIYNPLRQINHAAESRYGNSDVPEDQRLSTYLKPPEYELYDLQADADELINLSRDPQFAEVQKRLIEAMGDFQRQIKDPFADPVKFKFFVDEQLEMQEKRSTYRRKGYVWKHLNLFRADKGERQ